MKRLGGKERTLTAAVKAAFQPKVLRSVILAPAECSRYLTVSAWPLAVASSSAVTSLLSRSEI